jgi:hypothetical protein
MNTIEELLEMNLERLAAMTETEILAYLQPFLTIQPPMQRTTGAGAQSSGGTKVKLSSGKSVKELGQKLINRGPSQIDNAFLELIQSVASAGGQNIDTATILAATQKKKS